MPLKISESRCCQTGECGNTVCSEKVPVSRLPCGTQPLISRQAQLQQWDERGRKNEKAHNLAIAGNQRVAPQQEFTNWERPHHNLTEEENTTAAEEHGIDGVVGVAIGTKA